MLTATTLPRNVHAIPRRRAMEFLWGETQGRIFTAYFQKRDGSMRTMRCRRDVAKHVRGGSLPYDPKPKMLLPVFEMGTGREGADNYRMVNVATLVSFNIGGETFVVE